MGKTWREDYGAETIASLNCMVGTYIYQEATDPVRVSDVNVRESKPPE
jgi:hypothetical protein